MRFQRVKLIHTLIDRELAFATGTFFQNKLIMMHVECGSLVNGRKVFDCMTERNVFSWSVLITAYKRHGLPKEALTLFKQLQKSNVQLNRFIFASILPACAKLGALEQGMDIHKSIIRNGFSSDVVVGNALIDMYAKCGSFHKARKLFDKMPERDVVSWNMMIVGCVQNGALDEALRLFEVMPRPDVFSWNAILAGCVQNGFAGKAMKDFNQMQLAGVKPDASTFTTILPACAKMRALEQGMEIHHRLTRSGFLSNVLVGNALIDMYAKCGSIQKARGLFDKMPERDVVSWNVMIAGYAQNGFLDEASRLFKEMPQPNVVSWNAILAGYAQNGLVEKALEIFKQMQQKGVQPDQGTFASIIPACAKMGALEQGMEIHESIRKNCLLSNVVVGNAMIDMYAKCGSIQKARKFFDTMPQRDVVSWTAMITGYAMHGYAKDALRLFELMKNSGTYPDYVSFICVLFACSHVALVDEGCKLFNSMSESYGIMPTIDHYVCMVDLLGRAGYAEEALNFVIKMPIKPNVIVWMCLLGCCRSVKLIGLGEFVATLLFELDPINAAPYLFLSDIYAEEGRWDGVQRVRKLIKDRGIKKIPGCSWIEVDKTVHTFCVIARFTPAKTGGLCKVGNFFLGDDCSGYTLNSTRSVMWS
ncbi:pentatricopeptide repeat-containing protein At2g13600 [Cryptomeria japonica]|uniref:pentatricopeptide repeat-containing protein At2g13600 n=1 Tax=Cryptomeria japonica TaxID=3369 RepID=UPI0025ABB2F7|nr:pentatricopeptide repeat-containing protein At2g13600 [Cryptomeria japonica]XP_057840084.1 pentatricopeptide repeat-containing protein At2g13600 [Cryptomeria japonica]